MIFDDDSDNEDDDSKAAGQCNNFNSASEK